MINTNRKTICCNLFGAPGAGKSTLAAFIFAKLKLHGVNCELVTEYAKDKVWEQNTTALANQVYILAKQYYRLDCCSDKVDVIVTDSPIVLSPYYNKDDDVHDLLQQLACKISNKFNNLNYFVKRVKKYNPIGRLETEEESDKKAIGLKELLKSLDIYHVDIDGDLSAAELVVEDVLNYQKIIKK